MKFLTISCAFLALAACGDEPTGVDCAYFGESNCFKTNASLSTSCTSMTRGTMSADGLTCVLPGGASVSFATPISDPIPADYVWDFEVLHDGSVGPCMTFRELSGDETGFVMWMVSIGEYRHELIGDSLSMTCHGGEQYTISVADALQCDLATVPGFAVTSVGGGSFSFRFLGTDDARPLFECDWM